MPSAGLPGSRSEPRDGQGRAFGSTPAGRHDFAKEPALLPPGIALNVNHPTVAPADVKGIRSTVQGQATSASIVFVPIGGDLYVPAVGPGAGDEADVKDSDTEALAAGFITVTPIGSDLTAAPARAARLQSALAGWKR